jgi:hypothetical protein
MQEQAEVHLIFIDESQASPISGSIQHEAIQHGAMRYKACR